MLATEEAMSSSRLIEDRQRGTARFHARFVHHIPARNRANFTAV